MGEWVRSPANGLYDAAMGATRTSVNGWAADFAVTTLAALFLALMGPFGSYLGASFAQRLLFQLVCFWLGTLVFGSAVRLLIHYVAKPIKFWAALVLIVAVLVWPFSRITQAVGGTIWPVLAHVGPVEWYWEGLITAEPAVLIMAFFGVRRARPQLAVAAVPMAVSAGLLGTRPGDVLCLQMEDHYVRVHTRAGSKLILASLGQAIEAVGGVSGLQVHRSWWIAHGAVAGAEQDGRNLRLRLINGILAPVARSSVSQVRAAGLIGHVRGGEE